MDNRIELLPKQLPCPKKRPLDTSFNIAFIALTTVTVAISAVGFVLDVLDPSSLNICLGVTFMLVSILMCVLVALDVREVRKNRIAVSEKKVETEVIIPDCEVDIGNCCEGGKKYVIKNAHAPNLIIKNKNFDEHDHGDIFIEAQDGNVVIDSKRGNPLKNISLSPEIRSLTFGEGSECVFDPRNYNKLLNVNELVLLRGDIFKKGKYPPTVKKVTLFSSWRMEAINFSTVNEIHIKPDRLDRHIHIKNANSQSKLYIGDKCILSDGKLTIPVADEMKQIEKITLDKCNFTTAEFNKIQTLEEVMITNSTIDSLAIDQESTKKLRKIHFWDCSQMGKPNWINHVVANKNILISYDVKSKDQNETIKQLEEIRQDESSHACKFIVYEDEEGDA
jgi:hypothetical protein